MGRAVVAVVLGLVVSSVAAQPLAPRVPAELATFVRPHEANVGRWQVTVHELGGKGSDFLGHAVKNTGNLDRSITDKLMALLASDASFDGSAYHDGVRCMGSALGLRIQRGGASIDLTFECGRLQVGAHGTPVLVSPTLYAEMGEVESWALPCVPIVIPDLDIEVCMPRGGQPAGGGPQGHVLSAPRSPCPSLMIGTARPSDPKYLRKVGTFELSCQHDDEPACIKVCDTLRPLPHSTATEPFPPGQPIIDGAITWPFGSGFSIWSDGTVLFSGRACPKVRSQRAKLTAEHLARLLADIEAIGFFAARPPTGGGTPDAESRYLRVTAGKLTKRIDLGGGAKSAELIAAWQLIRTALGKNPCD